MTRTQKRRPRGRWVGLHWGLALLCTGPLVLSGCGTGGLAVKKDVWEAQEDFERRQTGLSEKVLQLEARLTAAEEELASLRHSIDRLVERADASDTDFSRGLEAVREGQQQLGIELENRIRSIDTAREEDRQDLLARIAIVLEEVTSENRRLAGEIEDLRGAMSVGYTHVVQRGETLAAIAAKYGVTVADIVGANDIPNPNVIAVGKSLFIPQN